MAYIREIVIKKMSVKKWNPGAKEEKKRKELRTRKGKVQGGKREETQSNSK